MLLTEKHEDLLNEAKYGNLTEAQRAPMALMIENQTKHVEELIREGTLSGDIAQFTPILIPMVRRVYPNLIANELVGIQPLSTPTGYIYALTHRYTGESTTGRTVTPTNKAQILVVADASGFTVDSAISTAAGATGVVIYVEGKNLLVKNTSATLFAASDVVDNATPFVGAATTVTATYSNEAQYSRVLKNYTGSYATAAGEALGKDMKEIGFYVDRKNVEAKTRKLKGKYTMEMFQDLKAQHGLNAEDELMNLMGLELNFEIDREVVSFVNGMATALPDVTLSTYDGRWEIEKMRMLGMKISNEAREIGRLTRRGPGNVLLASPKATVTLENIGKFIIAPVGATSVDANITGYTTNAGVFDNRYKVITDNFSDNEYVNVIYKGNNARDCGAFLAPYVGASMVKTVDPESGQPALILQTRYALDTTPLNPENYARTMNVVYSNTSLAG